MLCPARVYRTADKSGFEERAAAWKAIEQPARKLFADAYAALSAQASIAEVFDAVRAKLQR